MPRSRGQRPGVGGLLDRGLVDRSSKPVTSSEYRPVTRLGRRGAGLGAALALAAVSACAPVAPPANVVPKYPEYLFPTVPLALADTSAAARHQEAWLFLQAGDVRNAQRGFASALERRPSFYPAEAGLGYVGLARSDYQEAVAQFDRALQEAPAYVPALVGKGEALLWSDRAGAALESFEAALGADPGLTRIRRRVQLLRFDRMQAEVALARAATDSGSYGEARAAYERAIAASPESAFLYVEFGWVERRQGDLGRALGHARKAAELDRNDSGALTLEADVREAMGELEAAEQLFVRAYALDPSEELDARLERLRARIELASLPAEYQAIPEAPQISRAQLAALLGVRFDTLLQQTQQRRTVIITDTRDHWASLWVLSVTRASVMDVNVNYTFQPDTSVNRGELGQVVGRLIDLIAPGLDAPSQGQAEQPRFADIGPGHLRYPAASRAVAAGILPVLDGNTFQPTRPVSGAEAIAAIERLEALVTELD